MMFSAAFDLDGTLIDLPVDIEGARSEIEALFSVLNYHEPMRPILDAINRAAASVAINDEQIFPLILRARAILDRYEVESVARAIVRPGVLEALQKLRAANVPMGIVTNNSRACVLPTLSKMGLTTSDFVISTRDDVRRPKPAPDGLIRVASMLGEAGENMWFIGDSPVDVSAAVAANPQVAPMLQAIAVPGPRSSAYQLQAAGPCLLFDSFSEAVDYMLGS